MKSVYQNSYFNVNVHNEILSIENKRGGAAILPITPDHKVILLEVYRKPVGAISFEIPRGFSEPGEKPEETAQREMQEEISCRCVSVKPLGSMYVDSGLMDSEIYLYAGMGTEINKKKVQEEEGIRKARLFNADEVWQMAMSGRIKDSFTLAAVFRHFGSEIKNQW